MPSTLVAAPAHASGTDFNLAAVDTWLLPAYRKLESETTLLRSAASDYCKVTVRSRRATLQQAFARGLGAWQRVQLGRFGAVEFQLRAHRFELWPDKRGSVRRHLDRLLASQDAAARTSESFRSGSVAVQGFSALERLLFTEPPLKQQDPDTPHGHRWGQHRCGSFGLRSRTRPLTGEPACLSRHPILSTTWLR